MAHDPLFDRPVPPAGPRTGRRGALADARAAALVMAAWVGLLWLLEAVDTAGGHALDTYGVVPRHPGELRDVIPSAFIHFGYGHLAANTLPLFVLGFLAAARGGLGRFFGVATTIIVVSGMGVWLVAPSHTNTAGASGLIFGLFGYLVTRGFVDRKPLDIAVGLGVAGLYWSILWGVLPSGNGVSWQGHLFGLVGGLAAPFLFRRTT
ncbi:rhomboid family intramembrane serine protease [Wenjunlia tyrosinilytica]|uniref:Rhomboid family intramembrane serine protease n=2 Tax=Wenjunlia tyrosinilytica TaxID=1544741 RepID=A0A917ZSV0_9ACTN|nr:rhomboid family intramembrane serine protease [Wenjunlia tyrosinilytica]